MAVMADPEGVRLHNLAVGHVAEWLVWTRLVATSGGDLHVFLPLTDLSPTGSSRLSTDGESTTTSSLESC